MTLHRAALLLVASATFGVAACASGSAIVTGTTRTPVAPQDVKLYLEPPEAFEVIGLVHATSDAGWTAQGSLNYAIGELKKQAGKLGANGVLIIATGETTTGVVVGTNYAIPVTGKTVQGKAIFVTKK